MRKRRGPAASEDDDGTKLISLQDKHEADRLLRLAIVAFAIVIMMFVVLGTIINNQGGTIDTPVFPWEWGRED